MPTLPGIGVDPSKLPSSMIADLIATTAVEGHAFSAMLTQPLLPEPLLIELALDEFKLDVDLERLIGPLRRAKRG
tara:strand:+ start:517 stop:741 length:225 start_codon:yes stop_codon:yes gene_type:complete